MRELTTCRDDEQIVLAGMQKYPECLRYAGDAGRNNREVVLESVRRSPIYFPQYASERGQDEKEIVLEAVRKEPEYL